MVLIYRLEVMKVLPASTVHVTEVHKNRIRLTAGPESRLVAYLYKESETTRQEIDDVLAGVLEKKLHQRLIVVAVIMALPSAAVSLAVLYDMQNESLLVSILLFCVFSVAMIVSAVLAYGIMAGRNAQHKLHDLALRITYSKHRRDGFFHNLPELPCVISKADATPLARIVCDDVHRYWSHTQGDSALAQRARASMERAIIETINDALSFIGRSPLLSGRKLAYWIDKECVTKLVCKLSSISDDFKASERPCAAGKDQQYIASSGGTPTTVKRKLQAT